MHDSLESLVREEFVHHRAIGHIRLHEAESPMGAEALQPVELELDVVVRIEIVQPDDFVTPRRRRKAVVMPTKPAAPVSKTFMSEGSPVTATTDLRSTNAQG